MSRREGSLPIRSQEPQPQPEEDRWGEEEPQFDTERLYTNINIDFDAELEGERVHCQWQIDNGAVVVTWPNGAQVLYEYKPNESNRKERDFNWDKLSDIYSEAFTITEDVLLVGERPLINKYKIGLILKAELLKRKTELGPEGIATLTRKTVHGHERQSDSFSATCTCPDCNYTEREKHPDYRTPDFKNAPRCREYRVEELIQMAIRGEAVDDTRIPTLSAAQQARLLDTVLRKTDASQRSSIVEVAQRFGFSVDQGILNEVSEEEAIDKCFRMIHDNTVSVEDVFAQYQSLSEDKKRRIKETLQHNYSITRDYPSVHDHLRIAAIHQAVELPVSEDARRAIQESIETAIFNPLLLEAATVEQIAQGVQRIRGWETIVDNYIPYCIRRYIKRVTLRSEGISTTVTLMKELRERGWEQLVQEDTIRVEVSSNIPKMQEIEGLLLLKDSFSESNWKMLVKDAYVYHPDKASTFLSEDIDNQLVKNKLKNIMEHGLAYGGTKAIELIGKVQAVNPDVIDQAYLLKSMKRGLEYIQNDASSVTDFIQAGMQFPSEDVKEAFKAHVREKVASLPEASRVRIEQMLQ